MDSRLLQPAYIKELCRRYGFSPQKSLGQNYLVSALPVNAMIAAGELTPDDTVIEIGPGFGVLTLALSPLVRRVVAFEIEQTLRPYWEERCREYPNITVIWGEAIYELAKYQSELRGLRSYKVLANLPYQITSYALRTVLELEPPPERAVVMVQREVADRLSAGPGDMSLLSASVQYYGQPRITARVPRGSFWPSAVLKNGVLKSGAREWNRRFFSVISEPALAINGSSWRKISPRSWRPIRRRLKKRCGRSRARRQSGRRS